MIVGYQLVKIFYILSIFVTFRIRNVLKNLINVIFKLFFCLVISKELLDSNSYLKNKILYFSTVRNPWNLSCISYNINIVYLPPL